MHQEINKFSDLWYNVKTIQEMREYEKIKNRSIIMPFVPSDRGVLKRRKGQVDLNKKITKRPFSLLLQRMAFFI